MFGFYLFICLFVCLFTLFVESEKKYIEKKSKVLKNEYKKKVRFEKEH